MAKNALGRGLGSLLSGSFEDSEYKKPQPQATQSAVENNALAQTASVASPERVSIEVPESLIPHASTRPAASMRPAEIKEEVKTEENVVVKSMSSRNPEELPVESIHRNPGQPRINFKKEELDELSASIKKNGLLQPILVRPDGDNSYQIIAGERRYRACVQAGLKTVPVRIKQVSDEEVLELAMIENIQRADLNPIEEAYGYKRLMEKRALTQSEVAQLVSKGRSTIANSLRLLELPEDAQQLLYEEKITAGHARAILSIPSDAGKQKLTEKLIAEKISVREAEQLAKALSETPAAKTSVARPATPKSYRSVARSLREYLNTTVKVKTSQGRNRIEIEFSDEEDLERLFGILSAGQSIPSEDSEAD